MELLLKIGVALVLIELSFVVVTFLKNCRDNLSYGDSLFAEIFCTFAPIVFWFGGPFLLVVYGFAHFFFY